ncbi:hypothetical protein AB0C28_51645 [Nonomuraea sp. NPDC048892]|uniref:Uncharacterized protein n=1 Tax=Nonomuraea maheshkhaliensis TaxID=419590 RepID=A0ABP4RA99_9ACTN
MRIRYPKALPERVQQDIFQLLDDLDVAADAGPFEGRRAGAVIDLWTLLVAVPLATYSNAFLQKAGESTWQALCRAARRVALSRGEPGDEPLLIIEIEGHRTSFAFPSELDLDARLAIVRLLEGDHESGARYRWDPVHRSWTPMK